MARQVDFPAKAQCRGVHRQPHQPCPRFAGQRSRLEPLALFGAHGVGIHRRDLGRSQSLAEAVRGNCNRFRSGNVRRGQQPCASGHARAGSLRQIGNEAARNVHQLALPSDVTDQQSFKHRNVIQVLFPDRGVQTVVGGHIIALNPGRCQDFRAMPEHRGVFVEKRLDGAVRIARRQRARFVGRNSAAFAVRAAQKTVGRTDHFRRPQHLVEVDSQMGHARAEPVCRRRARFAEALLFGGAILAFVQIRQARLGRRTETNGRVRPKTEQQQQGGPKNWQRLAAVCSWRMLAQ